MSSWQDPVAVEVAKELALLASDESRLLSRIFDTVLHLEPKGHEAHALDVLCESCSENLPVRLARELLLRALGLRSRLCLAADNLPGLRSLSDGLAEEAAEELLEAPEDAERMLRWLWSFLSLPSEVSSPSRPCGPSLEPL